MLLADMYQPDFWHRADRLETLSRYELVDRVKAAVGTATGLVARLGRPPHGDTRYSRDLIARLATQLYLIEHGLNDVQSRAPVEVALCVLPVLESSRDEAAAAEWCGRLLAMYRHRAANRHMRWEEIGAGTRALPRVLVISGFGAAHLLAAENGLHVLEYEGGGNFDLLADVLS